MNLISSFGFILRDKKERSYLWAIILGIILITILETFSIATIIPVFNVIIFEKIPENNFFIIENLKLNSNLKILTLCLFFFIFFFKSIIVILFNYFFINFLSRLNIKTSNRLFYLYLKQDYIFFARGNSKNFLNEITDDVYKMNSFLLSLINVSTEIIFVVAISILLIFSNYMIFLFFFSIFFFSILIYFNFFKRRINDWSLLNTESSIKIKNLVIDGINGIKDLIIYKLEDLFCNSFNTSSYLFNSSKSKIDFLNNVQKYWLELIAIFAIVLASVYFVINNFNINTLIPVFGLFVFALFRLLNSFNRIVVGLQNLKYTHFSFVSIQKRLQAFESSKKTFENNKIQFQASIEFKNVTFFYESISHKTLNNINLKIKKGECIGILGNNGSGKSTLLYLLSGLIKPSEGIILIDEKFDLFKNRIQWYEKLSYVQQDIFLLNSTIKHNICLEEEHKVDNSKFDKIINDLELNLFFSNFPNKLNTQVGVNGLNLSGGQKQMISLGRALYKNSDIIILDEPSSALDTLNVALIKKNILSLRHKKTIFMVTHEKDLFNDCFDRIVNIKSGIII
jgi:ABC-type multidrug transport system fused ATPase/permease subunit